MPEYDLLVYHDFTDTKNDRLTIGDDAGALLGESFKGLYVTAIGPGIHAGRATVVLSSESRPDQQQEIKAYFARSD